MVFPIATSMCRTALIDISATSDASPKALLFKETRQKERRNCGENIKFRKTEFIQFVLRDIYLSGSITLN